MSNDDCLFCKIRDGKIPSTITYRDEDVFVFKDIGPKAPLHELVVPTRHVATLADAKTEDAELYGPAPPPARPCTTSTCTCWRDGR